MRATSFILFLVLIPALVCAQQKINGMSIAGDREPVSVKHIDQLQTESAANWVALTPYAFCSISDPNLSFNASWQWKGETTEGIAQGILAAQSKGLKVMLKPHIWVKEQGWAGDLIYSSEKDWLGWQNAYKNYILHFAKLADSLNVDLFCIGTEVRKSVVNHPTYWKELIREVRAVFKGQVTYAANWDNYQNVVFWSELDFIGIDAYFPIDTAQKSRLALMKSELAALNETFLRFSQRFDKPILFTEFGYRSIDYAAGNQWELTQVREGSPENFNAMNQLNAFRAFFYVFWKQPHVAGGFVWKWHQDKTGESRANDYSPQGKPAMEVINLWFSSF